ncbi:hypothetical protein GCM10029992_08830 [Glycomyces albus]
MQSPETAGLGSGYTYDREGDKVVVLDNITCDMPSIMESDEYWAYGEGSVVFNKLPKFDAHDQRAIESAQEAHLLRLR